MHRKDPDRFLALATFLPHLKAILPLTHAKAFLRQANRQPRRQKNDSAGIGALRGLIGLNLGQKLRDACSRQITTAAAWVSA